MRYFSFFVVLLFYAGIASAGVIGKAGAVYPIIEPDFVKEVKDNASRVNWSKMMKESFVKAKESFGVPQDVSLPRTQIARTRTFSPVYVLPFDVPNPSDLSEVLYPAGYQFNPLAYITAPGKIVFVDTSDPDQLNWLKKMYPQKSNNHLGDIIMITGGRAEKISNLLGRPVYVATSEMINSFKPEFVPCVFSQVSDYFEITEVLLPRKKGDL